MKATLILLLAFCFATFSCQKNAIEPKAKLLQPQSELTTVDRKSNFDFIIAHSWQYNKYYIGYVDSAHPGNLVYQRGRAGNTLDLDNVVVTYYADGKILENNNGTLYPGKWKFTDASQTVVHGKNATGTYVFPILFLNKSHFNWRYHATDNTERYAEMIGTIN